MPTALTPKNIAGLLGLRSRDWDSGYMPEFSPAAVQNQALAPYFAQDQSGNWSFDDARYLQSNPAGNFLRSPLDFGKLTVAGSGHYGNEVAPPAGPIVDYLNERYGQQLTDYYNQQANDYQVGGGVLNNLIRYGTPQAPSGVFAVGGDSTFAYTPDALSGSIYRAMPGALQHGFDAVGASNDPYVKAYMDWFSPAYDNFWDTTYAIEDANNKAHTMQGIAAVGSVALGGGLAAYGAAGAGGTGAGGATGGGAAGGAAGAAPAAGVGGGGAAELASMSSLPGFGGVGEIGAAAGTVGGGGAAELMSLSESPGFGGVGQLGSGIEGLSPEFWDQYANSYENALAGSANQNAALAAGSSGLGERLLKKLAEQGLKTGIQQALSPSGGTRPISSLTMPTSTPTPERDVNSTVATQPMSPPSLSSLDSAITQRGARAIGFGRQRVNPETGNLEENDYNEYSYGPQTPPSEVPSRQEPKPQAPQSFDSASIPRVDAPRSSPIGAVALQAGTKLATDFLTRPYSRVEAPVFDRASELDRASNLAGQEMEAGQELSALSSHSDEMGRLGGELAAEGASNFDFSGAADIPTASADFPEWNMESSVAAAEGCFLTEAATASTGAGDDGPELQTMRQFRDQVMLTNPNGQQLVEEYYQIAPLVVQAINARPDAEQVYQSIYDQFIVPSVEAIQSGDYARALQLYSAMIAAVTPLAQEMAGLMGDVAEADDMGGLAQDAGAMMMNNAATQRATGIRAVGR